MAVFSSVLIDISGVLYVGNEPVPGAIHALQRLRDAGLGLRLLTNTTRRTRDTLVDKLSRLGFSLSRDEILTAGNATRAYLENRDLRPHLLVHPDLLPEFAGLDTTNPNAVVVGDAGEDFNYRNLNAAFRVLMQCENPHLIAMGGNRYFQDETGLSLDMGPFVAALQMASGVDPVTTGKPAAAFFNAALEALDTAPERAVMIGDDLENDVGGAQRAGLRGVLVRTGKYRADDEQHPDVQPDFIADDFPAAVAWILGDA